MTGPSALTRAGLQSRGVTAQGRVPRLHQGAALLRCDGPRARQDYEGSQLMEFKLHARVEYMNIPAMLHRQKQVSLSSVTAAACDVLQQLQAQAQDEKKRQLVYPGLTVFAEGKSFIPIDKIPGVLEAGWRPDDDTFTGARHGRRTHGFNLVVSVPLTRDIPRKRGSK